MYAISGSLIKRNIHFRKPGWRRVSLCLPNVDGAFPQRVLFCGCNVPLGGNISLAPS